MLSVYPALAFLAFMAFRIFQQTHPVAGGRKLSWEFVSPLIIGLGLLSMHNGRTKPDGNWTILFWFGETIVVSMFAYNSVAANSSLPKTSLLLTCILVFSVCISLWFRGYLWNYVVVLVFEAFLAIVAAMSFPVVEMVLDAVLNEKLRKVGDRVRAHHAILERYYKKKLEEAKRK